MAAVEWRVKITSGGRQDHVGVFRVGGNLGNPAIVPEEGSSLLQSFRHFVLRRVRPAATLRSESTNGKNVARNGVASQLYL